MLNVTAPTCPFPRLVYTRKRLVERKQGSLNGSMDMKGSWERGNVLTRLFLVLAASKTPNRISLIKKCSVHKDLIKIMIMSKLK